MFVDVDNALLAVPNFAVDGEEAQRLIDRVQHVASITLPSHPCRVRVWSDAEEFLWGNNVGPDLNQISEFLDLVQLEAEYSAHDLSRLYNIILANAGRILTEDNPAIDATDVAIAPQIPTYLAPLVLAEQCSKHIVHSVYQRGFGDPNSFIASPFARDGLLSFHATFSVRYPDGICAPFAGSTVAISHISDLATSESSYALWCSANNEDEYALAIALGVMSIVQRDQNIGVDELLDFGFADGLFETLHARGATSNGRTCKNVFEILCRLIAGVCTNDRHEYGQSGSLIRASDGSVGWRLHVTKRSEGLRLMYWRGNNYVEFANLDVKRDVRILGGDGLAKSKYSVANLVDR